jgi:hypothetical protein
MPDTTTGVERFQITDQLLTTSRGYVLFPKAAEAEPHDPVGALLPLRAIYPRNRLAFCKPYFAGSIPLYTTYQSFLLFAVLALRLAPGWRAFTRKLTKSMYSRAIVRGYCGIFDRKGLA